MRLPPDHPKVGRAARRAFRNYARYLADVMRLADETPDDIGAWLETQLADLDEWSARATR